MLNRTQQNTLHVLYNRKNNFFGNLPKALVREICRVKNRENHLGIALLLHYRKYKKQEEAQKILDQHPELENISPLAQLLHHIAFGNPDEAKQLLDKNPELLYEADDVFVPGGDKILCVTPYECALGAGDEEMVALIAPYFSEFKEEGEREKERQASRYREAIENMLEQKPYDFGPLLKVIANSSSEDVQAALNKDFKRESKLNEALTKLRNDFKPKEIKAGMHYRYVDLQEIYKKYKAEFGNLVKGNDYSRCYLVTRQVVGYLQRGLPACDRQAYAMSLYDRVEAKLALARTFALKYERGATFPAFVGADLGSFIGLGFDFFIDGGVARGGRPALEGPCGCFWNSYVKQKRQTCRTYTIAAGACEALVHNRLR